MNKLSRLVLAGMLVCALGFLVSFQSAQAQPGGPNPGEPNPAVQGKLNGIQWLQGPCKATMRNICQVDVPAGYKFTGEAGTVTLMELTQNLPSSSHLGLLAPATFPEKVEDWFLVFEWEGCGYIKDDDKKLDADALLEALRAGQTQANTQLRSRGLPELTLVGWTQPPFYDPQTKLLTWGTQIRANNGAGESVNYNSRMLGKSGVLSVNLVIDPQLLQRELPKYKEILKATSFQPGETYGEWKTGDKVATYGLAALVTGGVAAGLAKSGLLGKLGKGIIYIVIAVVAGIGSLFKKIFGGRSSTA